MTRSGTDTPAYSLVIPTLNEAENIYPLFTRIFDMAETANLAVEIVVVDDNSTDGTQEQVRKWEHTHPVTLVCRKGKDGLASAVIEGAQAARARTVVVMDADLSHPPEVIPDLVRPLADGTHDIVIGSRYTKGGATPDWPKSRKIASRLATIPARILTDPQDPLAGFFAVSRTLLAGLDKSVSGFKIGLEALVAGEGKLRVAEVPIVFYDRYKGKSKMNKRIILEYFRQVLNLIGFLPAPSFAKGLRAAFCIGGLLDVLIFWALYHWGHSPGAAHIGGFVGASLVSIAIHLRWTFPGKGRTLSEAGGVLMVYALTLFLRGTVLAGLLALGCPLAPAVLLTVLFSLSLSACGLAVIACAGYGNRPTADVRLRILCVGTVVFLFFLRLVAIGLPALLEEEAYYWNYAQHLDIGYLDHPPMVAVLIRLGTFLFGNNEFGVRIPALMCWLVTAFFSYRLTRSLYGRAAAFRSPLLLSVLPVFFAIGMMMTPDAPLTACWSAVIYYLYRAFLLEERTAWVYIGIFLGFGMFSKYTIVLLGPAIVLFMILDPRSRRWFRRPEPYLAALTALVIFSPVIAWNLQHDWASFVFQGEKRVTGTTAFSTPVLIGSILLLLTPVGFLSFFSFLRHGREYPAPRQAMPEKGRIFLLFLLLLLAPLSVFVVFSLTKEVKLNWTGPLWLALVPFMAATMAPAGEDAALLRWCRKLWPPTIVVLLLFSGLFIHYFSMDIPGVPISDRPFLTGWDTLVARVERIVDAETARYGKRPVVVGMDKYKIASGLAFYRYKYAVAHKSGNPARAVAETSSSHIFGWTGLMYAYWFPKEMLAGRDLVLVSASMDMLDESFLQNFVDELGEIREIDVKKDGQLIDRFYVRFVRGYHPE